MADESVAQLLEYLAVLGRRNSLRDPVASMVADIGLGSAQIHAVMWLREDGPLTMGVLAQRCSVTDKTITGIVDRLERDQYVIRERDEKDRRVVRVVLLEKGRSLAEELYESVRQHMEQFLEMLSSKDRRDLFRILRNIIARLDASPPSE